MNDNKDSPPTPPEKREYVTFGDKELYEFKDTKIPKFLIFTYIFFPLWGILWFFLFWNGSNGWLDRGHWGALEQAANTKAPIEKKYKTQKREPVIPLKNG
ncbi:hypothetical protein JYU14_00725 [Simkania negevensis]|uniref:Uncharacterized protein n=1 Tax=Simkania negevensis TaxID=83561 RepID=A0ABS3ASK2_9BACT|nr:hypothetical protein [Simkania negevensis]